MSSSTRSPAPAPPPTDGLLGCAGDIDTYAHSVFTLLTKHQQPLPDKLPDTACRTVTTLTRHGR